MPLSSSAARNHLPPFHNRLIPIIRHSAFRSSFIPSRSFNARLASFLSSYRFHGFDMPERESLFDNLPDYIKSTHWTSPGHKEWRYCAHCRRCQNDDFKVRRCEGCAEKNGQQVFYCGRECQKKNWPIHKGSCLLGRPDPDSSNERSVQLLGRWMYINRAPLRWCVEQVYYYTPRADPSTTLVSFWIDGKTRRLSRIAIRKRDDREAGCFMHVPCLSTIHLEHPKSPGSSRKAFYYDFDGTGDPGITYDRIFRHPQYPWIAATIFGTLTQPSPSAATAEQRLAVLCAAVTHHISRGSLTLPTSFIARPIVCSLQIPSTQMLLWNHKLKSIDLWEPFNNPKYMVSSMLNLNLQSFRSHTALDLERRSNDAIYARIDDHSACLDECCGHD